MQWLAGRHRKGWQAAFERLMTQRRRPVSFQFLWEALGISR